MKEIKEEDIFWGNFDVPPITIQVDWKPLILRRQGLVDRRTKKYMILEFSGSKSMWKSKRR